MNNNNIKMSATRISMYLTCRWKYWCNYVLRLPRKPNVAFKLGLAVHEALAEAGKIWEIKEKLTTKDIYRVKDVYNRFAAQEGIDNTTIYHEGLQMVSKRLNNFVSGKILSVEDKFEVATDQGVILIGAMDKVELLGEDTVLVSDYKTSKYFETAAELRSDIQLSVYDAVAHIKYPEYRRIILSLDYLRGEPVYTYRTDQERDQFLNYLLALYRDMRALRKDGAIPTLNEMCNWCDFTDNCTAYQEALSSKSFIKKKPEEYDDEELNKNNMDIKKSKRIIDNQERQLKQFILNKIKSEGKDVLGAGKCLYVRQNANTVYNVADIHKNIPMEDFLKMVNVSKKDVDEYLERHPALRDRLTSSTSKSYTSPFLAYKNI